MGHSQVTMVISMLTMDPMSLMTWMFVMDSPYDLDTSISISKDRIDGRTK